MMGEEIQAPVEYSMLPEVFEVERRGILSHTFVQWESSNSKHDLGTVFQDNPRLSGLKPFMYTAGVDSILISSIFHQAFVDFSFSSHMDHLLRFPGSRSFGGRKLSNFL